jgi:hypothetical protein
MNHSSVFKKLFTVALLVLSIAISSTVFAGTDFVKTMPTESYGKCTQSGDTMSCTGSFRAIRAQQTDASRWANISITNGGGGGIFMQYNNTFYGCVAPNTQAWNHAFLAAISSSYFMVSYSVNTGVCQSLQVLDGSQFRNLSAL